MVAAHQAGLRFVPPAGRENRRRCTDFPRAIRVLRTHPDSTPRDPFRRAIANGYQEYFCRSVEEPEVFRAEKAGRLHWRRMWDREVDHDNPPIFRRLIGGETNPC